MSGERREERGERRVESGEWRVERSCAVCPENHWDVACCRSQIADDDIADGLCRMNCVLDTFRGGSRKISLGIP